MKTQIFEIDATTNDGVKVPLKFTIEYPDGQGLIAYKSLDHFANSPQVQQAFITTLAQQGDTSLIAAMERRGMRPDYDDDTWGEDDD